MLGEKVKGRLGALNTRNFLADHSSVVRALVFKVDPAMKLSASLRMTGLQILNTALITKHQDEKGTSALLADSEIRDFLLRDISISVLRTLGLASEPSIVIAQAFSVVDNLLVVLGKLIPVHIPP